MLRRQGSLQPDDETQPLGLEVKNHGNPGDCPTGIMVTLVITHH